MCGFVLKFGYTPKSIVWTTNMKILASNQNLYGRWALGGPQRTPKMTFFKVFINVVFLMEINSLYIKYKIIAKKNFFFRTGRFVGGAQSALKWSIWQKRSHVVTRVLIFVQNHVNTCVMHLFHKTNIKDSIFDDHIFFVFGVLSWGWSKMTKIWFFKKKIFVFKSDFLSR